jgi:hypothetical protein
MLVEVMNGTGRTGVQERAAAEVEGSSWCKLDLALQLMGSKMDTI